MEDIVAQERARHEAYERDTIIEGYSIAALRVCFDEVCDKQNWKLPVNAEVKQELLAPTLIAIEFFTGSKARARYVGDGKFKVWALGYYEACGA